MKTTEQLLDICLKEMETGETTVQECLERHSARADTLEPLLKTAERFTLAPRPVPSSAFRGAARDRMLNLMASAVPPSTFRKRSSWWSHALRSGRLLPAALSLSMLLTILVGTVVVASEASSSSPFYPLRLSLEELRVGLAANPAEKEALYLSFADSRIEDLVTYTVQDPDAKSGALPDERIQEISTLYRQEVVAAIRESGGTAGEATARAGLEVRLAAQEEKLRGVLELDAAGRRSVRSDITQLVEFIQESRSELRGGDAGQSPEAGPAQVSTAVPVQRPGPRRNEGVLPDGDQSRFASPSPEATPTVFTPSGMHSGQDDVAGWHTPEPIRTPSRAGWTAPGSGSPAGEPSPETVPDPAAVDVSSEESEGVQLPADPGADPGEAGNGSALEATPQPQHQGPQGGARDPSETATASAPSETATAGGLMGNGPGAVMTETAVQPTGVATQVSSVATATALPVATAAAEATKGSRAGSVPTPVATRSATATSVVATATATVPAATSQSLPAAVPPTKEQGQGASGSGGAGSVSGSPSGGDGRRGR